METTIVSPVEDLWNVQGTAKVSSSLPAEPSAWTKWIRRVRVFGLAGRIFCSYKWVQFQESILRNRLGLSENSNDGEDHPDIVTLWETAHTRNAQRLLQGINNLQGFWIKIGQYLSSRADVMPRPYLDVLSQLQDGVVAKPWSDVCCTLMEEKCIVDNNGRDDELLLRLTHVDTTPLSTASLAQVHRATLSDGRDVVLKVQHRGVASLMRQDMDNLRTLLTWLSRSDPDLDYTPVVQEYTCEVTRELDFRTEATNMQEIKDFLKKEGIQAIVPDTVLATERVLVMDFGPGFPIRDIEQLDAYKVDRRLLLERVCQSWAAQMHRLGIFNCDPHAGNILVS
jgi:aarF domain-containing kinase